MDSPLELVIQADRCDVTSFISSLAFSPALPYLSVQSGLEAGWGWDLWNTCRGFKLCKDKRIGSYWQRKKGFAIYSSSPCIYKII